MARKKKKAVPSVRYFTTGQVAGLLKVDPRTVRRYCSDGFLPCIMVGRVWRISENHLREYLGLGPRDSIGI